MSDVQDTPGLRRLKPPTREQLAQYAASHYLPASPRELDEYLATMTASLSIFELLDKLDNPEIPLRHPYRDPGRPPTATEDPYNAVIRFCEVRGANDGPLAGKRIGVKDCIAVAGIPMTSGGQRRPLPVPTEDAVVVERLLDAGATIVAKTNMADMSLGHGESSAFGATKNPRNPRFSPGGSSSGSGAAVAAGLADAALGADQGGSLRVPSAWCGIVGMKASHGLVPSHGLVYMDHTLDHIGPMTTTVADNAAMLEIIAGGDWRDPQWVRADPVAGKYTAAANVGINDLRIGVITESLEPSGCTPGMLESFERARKALSHLGADVVPVSVPLWTHATVIMTAALPFWMTAMTHSLGQGYGHLGRVDINMMSTAAAQFRLGARDLPVVLRNLLLIGEHLREAYQGVHFGKAQNLRLELRRQVDELFAEVDLLITPTTPTGPFELATASLNEGEMVAHEGTEARTATLNTCPFSLTGHPALTVPAGLGDNELPAGLQIIGPRFDESTVYRAGFAFESEQAATM